MHRLRTVTSLDVSAVAGHHAMPAALLFLQEKKKINKKSDSSNKKDLDLRVCLGRVKLVL